ncbi:MAG: cyclic nucleotide-binding domain-containing protein [Gammaproteobacteria bacterium]|nr:cyclic nucleotide-binding domain-containing protein [Gammaproteobacteria bacterium]
MTDRILPLQNAPVSGGLSAAVVRFLVASSRTGKVPAGKLFFAEGDQGGAMYALRYGGASVYRSSKTDDKLLRLLGEGDCCGEKSLTDLRLRSASVRALEDCRPWRFRRMLCLICTRTRVTWCNLRSCR